MTAFANERRLLFLNRNSKGMHCEEKEQAGPEMSIISEQVLIFALPLDKGTNIYSTYVPLAKLATQNVISDKVHT